eukprot:CAMPEP_0174932050 /NCGR_PEP_ID=MMETSP1355-20121228/35497_1 /TAXON_ID=464990 /ORGANISM="Hemiselmis tepida, Strain CCMP443" /LENGTH=73 /DNA_ID=CAMNT_0016178447 /DNA_START=181 /DNA_END=402 /DNA_ORIENTATION=+
MKKNLDSSAVEVKLEKDRERKVEEAYKQKDAQRLLVVQLPHHHILDICRDESNAAAKRHRYHEPPEDLNRNHA